MCLDFNELAEDREENSYAWNFEKEHSLSLVNNMMFNYKLATKFQQN